MGKTLTDNKENVFAGIAGAFIFSLVGGFFWFVLYQGGIFASFSGFIGAALSIKGYGKFAGKDSKKGVIIAIIISLVVLVIAWYFCLSFDIYKAYKEWYKEGEIDYTVTFFESIQVAPMYLEEPEIRSAYLRDLAGGMFFALLGALSVGISSFRNIKLRQTIPEEAIDEKPLNIEGEDAAEMNNVGIQPLRSAVTDEKIHNFAEARAFGHDIIYRKVGKSMEELVIDGMVYAEHECGKSFLGVPKAHQFHVYYKGHKYEAGYFRNNYIAVDDIKIAFASF